VSLSDLATSRTRFREAALNYWVALKERDSDKANDESAKTDSIVAEWVANGQVGELLEPLARDADEEVRFAAASHLLSHGGEDLGIPVLEALQALPRGLVAPTARLRLMKWRREHK
jgi:hypothetical protein